MKRLISSFPSPTWGGTRNYYFLKALAAHHTVSFLCLADHPTEFVQTMVRLLSNPEMRTTLGNTDRALVEKKYSWEYSSAKLIRILRTDIS